MVKNIYVLGNVLVKEDSLPLRILPRLRKEIPEVNFIELDPTENIPKENVFVMIDTAINANEICVVDDIDKLQVEKVYGLHDFDLAYNLKLMKKFSMIDSIRIIVVPPDIEEEKAVLKIKKIITNLIY